jgi:histidinol-phosphate aminotransferase
VGGIRVVVTLKDHRLDLPTMARAMTPLTKLVFIANPNNPTGTIVTTDEVEKFLDETPERAIVVFDEAYVDFAQGSDFPDSLGYLRQGRRVVILRTFSKVASLAGLRVGYAIADPDCIALVNRIRQPFNVNSIAQVAALAALEDEEHARASIAMIQAGIKTLYRAFDELGLHYVPTRANFIYIEVPDARKAYQQLLRAGVIVRPALSFGAERGLRITVGTPEENARLIEALRTVVRK